MSEMEGCYIDQNLSSKNVLLIIENINEDSFRYYEVNFNIFIYSVTMFRKASLDCLLLSVINKKIFFDVFCGWNAIIMHHYSVPSCLHIVASKRILLQIICFSLLELNIGARRRPELPLRHPPYVGKQNSCNLRAFRTLMKSHCVFFPSWKHGCLQVRTQSS